MQPGQQQLQRALAEKLRKLLYLITPICAFSGDMLIKRKDMEQSFYSR